MIAGKPLRNVCLEESLPQQRLGQPSLYHIYAVMCTTRIPRHLYCLVGGAMPARAQDAHDGTTCA